MSSRGGLNKGRDTCFEIVSKFSTKAQGRVPGLWVLGLQIKKAIKDTGPEYRLSGLKPQRLRFLAMWPQVLSLSRAPSSHL